MTVSGLPEADDVRLAQFGVDAIVAAYRRPGVTG